MNSLSKLSKAYFSIQYPLGRRALRHGVGLANEHAALLRRLAPSLVIDVGANRGQFALMAATICREASIHAFEPLPQATTVLRALAFDEPRLVVHECALGAEPRTDRPIYISRRDDSSSLLRNDLQDKIFPGTQTVGEMNVVQDTLDRRMAGFPIFRDALLKLDVQGAELDVLRGASSSVLPQVGHIYCEVSFLQLYQGQPLIADVVSYLDKYGFSLMEVSNVVSFDGKPVQADALFSYR